MPTFSIHPLIPSIVFIILGALLTIFFFLNKERKQISLRMFLIYTFCAVLAFALSGVIGLVEVEDAFLYFIIVESVFLLIGICHAVALYYFNSEAQRSSFWYEFVFTLYIGALGIMIFYLVFGWLNKTSYTLYFLPGFILFIVPFFFMKSFDLLLAVPAEEYTKWYYPIDKIFDELDVDDFDDRQMLLIKYKIERSDASGDFFSPTYRSPLRALLGEHFARFITDFNAAYPGKKIQYLDQFGQPQGWNFYIEPQKWYQTAIYLDPNLTYVENEIRDGDIIVCERIK